MTSRKLSAGGSMNGLTRARPPTSGWCSASQQARAAAHREGDDGDAARRRASFVVGRLGRRRPVAPPGRDHVLDGGAVAGQERELDAVAGAGQGLGQRPHGEGLPVKPWSTSTPLAPPVAAKGSAPGRTGAVTGGRMLPAPIRTGGRCRGPATRQGADDGLPVPERRVGERGPQDPRASTRGRAPSSPTRCRMNLIVTDVPFGGRSHRGPSRHQRRALDLETGPHRARRPHRHPRLRRRPRPSWWRATRRPDAGLHGGQDQGRGRHGQLMALQSGTSSPTSRRRMRSARSPPDRRRPGLHRHVRGPLRRARHRSP